MKKKLLITLNALLAFGVLQAQIVNLGGTITVQSGATLVVEGNVDNQSGTIANSGTIEIKGNFNNAAAGTTLSGTGSYIFNGGTANATITTNGDAINNLTIDKSGFDVVLTDPLTVNGALTFGGAGNSNLVLGGSNLNLGTGASVSGADAGGYVEANGAGSIVKSMSGPAAFTFPVGDATNHMPLAFSNPIGAGAGSISARIGDAALKPASITNNFTNDHWIISSPNYGGDYMGTYSGVTGSSSNIVGYTSTDGTTFSGAGTGNGTNTVTKTGVSASSNLYFTGYEFLREFTLKVFLQGAFDSVNNVMTTQLPTLGLGTAPTGFPSVSPYGTGETISSIPANVTDWIKVEIVDPTNPSTIYAQASGFVRNDGTVINTTGGSTILLSGITQPSGSIRIKHRNHLMTRTNPITWTTNGLPNEFDFTTSTNDANVFTISSFGAADTINAGRPMRRFVSGRRALYQGDINQSGANLGIIKYNGSGNDRLPIYQAIGSGDFSLSLMNVYRNEDINLNKEVLYNGSGNDRLPIYRVIGSGDFSLIVKAHN